MREPSRPTSNEGKYLAAIYEELKRLNQTLANGKKPKEEDSVNKSQSGEVELREPSKEKASSTSTKKRSYTKKKTK